MRERLQIWYYTELKKLYQLSWKEKIEYIWTYYKLWIIGIVSFLTITVFLTVRICTNIKGHWLYGMFANTFADAGTGSALWEDFFPLFLTCLDAQMMPLYAFVWTFFGFGAIAMLTAKLLLPLFVPHLPLVDAAGDFILDENGNPLRPGDEDSAADPGPREKSGAEILEKMKKLGM